MPPKAKPSFDVKLVAPEDIEVGKEYSITINPNDDHQHWNDIDRISKVQAYLHAHLKDYPNSWIVSQMEISRNGRLHIHGTIKFTSLDAIKKFYLFGIHVWLKTMNIEIDTIDTEEDMEYWTDYIIKSKHLIDVKVSTELAIRKAKSNLFQQDVQISRPITSY